MKERFTCEVYALQCKDTRSYMAYDSYLEEYLGYVTAYGDDSVDYIHKFMKDALDMLKNAKHDVELRCRYLAAFDLWNYLVIGKPLPNGF